MEPITREEQYLANIAGDDVQIPSKPLTRVEAYLARVVENVADNADLSAIAPDYADLEFPVSEGDICAYEKKLYCAKQDISTEEEWDSTHWDETTVAAELKKAVAVTLDGSVTAEDDGEGNITISDAEESE